LSNIENIEFSFNGKSIPLSTSHKHQGVILSQNAKWNEHLENMITNITKHLGILRKLKFGQENSMFSMLPVLEKNNISAFSGLNDISHLLDQAFSSSRS
jgi:hypothetical protein